MLSKTRWLNQIAHLFSLITAIMIFSIVLVSECRRTSVIQQANLTEPEDIMKEKENILHPDDFFKIKRGMTKEEVVDILGDPHDVYDNTFRYVAYSDPHHCHSVKLIFDKDVVKDIQIKHWMEYPER